MNISNRFEPEVYQMLAVDFKEALTASLPFDGMVSDLVTHFKELWWSCEAGRPALGQLYSLKEQKVHEASLGDSLDRLGQELQRISRERPDQAALQERLFPLAGTMLKASFGLEDRHVQALPSYGFAEAVGEFVRQARRFDPELCAADIYQAGRNAW